MRYPPYDSISLIYIYTNVFSWRWGSFQGTPDIIGLGFPAADGKKLLEIHQDEYQRQWSSYPQRHVHGMDHISLCIHRSILNHSVTTFHPKQRKHDMVNTSNVWLLPGLSEFIMICSMKIFTISYSSIPTSPVAFPIVSIIFVVWPISFSHRTLPLCQGKLPWNLSKWVRIRWQCGIHGRSTACAMDYWWNC